MSPSFYPGRPGSRVSLEHLEGVVKLHSRRLHQGTDAHGRRRHGIDRSQAPPQSSRPVGPPALPHQHHQDTQIWISIRPTGQLSDALCTKQKLIYSRTGNSCQHHAGNSNTPHPTAGHMGARTPAARVTTPVPDLSQPRRIAARGPPLPHLPPEQNDREARAPPGAARMNTVGLP